MKIIVKDADSGFHISIPLPLFVLRSRHIWRLGIFDGLDDKAKAAAADFARTAAKALRRYVQKNGHFKLVEVHSAGGDTVEISV